MLPLQYELEKTDVAAAYRRRFALLTDVAAQLEIPSDVAEKLIDDVLLASLVQRSLEDLDAWLVAALKSAASRHFAERRS